MIDNKKRILGQYYTNLNPFNNKLFKEWFEYVGGDEIILEPFAGSNNIVKQIREIGIDNRWSCYDIEPAKINVCDDVPISIKDTIKDFPKGYNVCITNPPYLAKNSATKNHMPFPDTEYDDLYKLCLKLMLDNCEYVAAIIPESFITANLFLKRLYGIISLNGKMFEETNCPVCLALFVPRTGIKIYLGKQYIGNYFNILKYDLSEYDGLYKWKFNDKYGEIGMKCVDNQLENDIKFIDGEYISPDDIKISSRAFTRISGLPQDVDREKFIKKCNEVLEDYRGKTKDVFLTSFKGLRKDGRYRRRIDFKTAKRIMNKTLKDFFKK